VQALSLRLENSSKRTEFLGMRSSCAWSRATATRTWKFSAACQSALAIFLRSLMQRNLPVCWRHRRLVGLSWWSFL